MELDILARHAVEIEVVEPGAGEKLAQQLSNHIGVVEQEVIEAVVICHAPDLSRCAGGVSETAPSGSILTRPYLSGFVPGNR